LHLIIIYLAKVSAGHGVTQEQHCVIVRAESRCHMISGTPLLSVFR